MDLVKQVSDVNKKLMLVVNLKDKYKAKADEMQKEFDNLKETI